MSLLNDLIGMFFGGGPPGASVTTETEKTGYNVAEDIAEKVRTLERLQSEAIFTFPADPLPGGKWETKCNFGLIHVANGLECHDLDGLNATKMVRRAADLCLSNPEDWREDSWARAAIHANKGGFAFIGREAPAGEAHGHVASVAPKAMEKSGSWDMLVPFLANVGRPPNDVKKASACFFKDDIPALRCFLWRSE